MRIVLLLSVLLVGCGGVKSPPAPTITLASEASQPAVLRSLRAHHCATVQIPDKYAVAGGDGDTRTAPVSSYLLEHPAEGWILIDACYGKRTATDPTDLPGKLPVKLLGLEMRDPLSVQLEDVGLVPDDIRHILLTHLHHDHVAGVEDFPAAKLWANRGEWSFAQKKRALKGFDPVPYEGRGAAYFEDQGPWGPFKSHHDVFGDGSLVALFTPGHTKGSTVFVAQLESGPVMITGDTAWVDENWRRPVPKGWLIRSLEEHDWRANVDALWRIKAWADDHPEATVISGHEPDNLDRLPAWPEAFDGNL